MILRRNISGIIASGYEDGHLQVILPGRRRIEFLSDVPEAEHSAMLSSPNPRRYLDDLLRRYRHKDPVETLG